VTDRDSAYRSGEGCMVERDGAVLRLTLDRPEKRNALSDEMTETMIEAVETAGRDERVRAIVLAGRGDHFCGGADITSRNAPRGERPRVGSIQRRVPQLAHRLVPALLSVQVPVVCRVQGWAAGIGCQLALASDFAVVASDARLWEPFGQRGFTPDSGATWLLPRLAGVARARRMLLLGEAISGDDAVEWGLVHQACDAGELDEEVEVLVARLADGPTVALGLTKWLLLSGATANLPDHLHNEALALELSSRSEDFREGLAAFSEKRDPEFKGR
jgi:2-(1,2-epoxy-1,2-dihydrophenyl)acetyl-CoA isomerase